MKVTQIFTNTIWYGLIPKLPVFINVLLLPLITPYLTRFDYGIYGILTSYSGIASLIAVMGLNIHLTNSFYVYKNHFRIIWGRILFILLLSGIIFAAIYGLIISQVLTDVSGSVKVIAIVCTCIPIAFIANVTIAQHYYPLVYRPLPLVVRNLIASLLGVVVTFVSIYYFRLGFLGWVIGLAVSAITAFILFIPSLWIKERISPIICFDGKRIRRWLRVSLPIIPHSLGFILLGSSDRIIMDFLGVSTEDIGIYTNGYQMGDYAVVFTSAMIISIAPRIQELFRASKFIELKKLYLFCQTITVFVVVMISIWMPQIYQLLIRNPELYTANGIATLICFANIAFPFYTFISTAAFIREDTGKVLYLIFVPGALNIILNLIFIPIYGYQVAVVTTLIAYWSQLMIPYCIPYFRDTARLLFGNLYIPGLLLVIFIVLVIVSYFVAQWELAFKVVASMGAISLFGIYLLKQRKYNF